jgi:hypothetical protein
MHQTPLDQMRNLVKQLQGTVMNGGGVSTSSELEKGKKGKEIRKSEKYNDEDADVTIVSSDGVALKVHSFLLTRAS